MLVLVVAAEGIAFLALMAVLMWRGKRPLQAPYDLDLNASACITNGRLVVRRQPRLRQYVVGAMFCGIGGWAVHTAVTVGPTITIVEVQVALSVAALVGSSMIALAAAMLLDRAELILTSEELHERRGLLFPSRESRSLREPAWLLDSVQRSRQVGDDANSQWRTYTVYVLSVACADGHRAVLESSDRQRLRELACEFAATTGWIARDATGELLQAAVAVSDSLTAKRAVASAPQSVSMPGLQIRRLEHGVEVIASPEVTGSYWGIVAAVSLIGSGFGGAALLLLAFSWSAARAAEPDTIGAWVGSGCALVLLGIAVWLLNLGARLGVIALAPVKFRVLQGSLTVEQGRRPWPGWSARHDAHRYTDVRPSERGDHVALIGADGEVQIAGPFPKDRLNSLASALRRAIADG